MSISQGSKFANLAWGFDSGGSSTGLDDADVVIVDLKVSAATVAAHQSAGRTVVCYVSMGTLEEFRADVIADYDSWLDVSVGAIAGWEDELWLDISIPELRTLLVPRFEEAASKGCDAIEPDNVDCALNFEDCGSRLLNSNGQAEANAAQIAFNIFLADTAHDNGLLVALKNTPDFVSDLVGDFDFVITENCVGFCECEEYEPFLLAGKAVVSFEYTPVADQYCAGDTLGPGMDSDEYFFSLYCAGNGDTCTVGTWDTCYVKLSELNNDGDNCPSLELTEGGAGALKASLGLPLLAFTLLRALWRH